MRKPTENLLAYHSATLARERAPVYEIWPECGWYLTRAVKNGPWIPVKIWLEQVVDRFGDLEEPEVLRAMRWLDEIPVAWVWPSCSSRAITEDAYNEMIGRFDEEYARATHAAIDLSAQPMRPRK